VDVVNRDEYLRHVTEGFELAFEKGDLEAGAARYTAALGSLAPGELAYPGHHGEYASILQQLNQPERALAEHRRAVDAAERQAAADPDSIEVALTRYFLGEQLLRMGKPQEVLEAVAPCIETATSFAGPILVLQAESLAATGRLVEAGQAAAQAVLRATDAQRPRIRERLLSLVEGT
jgi:tetratricopeptide (TPR) repeat protein